MTHVVVIGDIHGNARALQAALDVTRRGRCDHVVFVGDLLTYGHDVAEVLDLVHDAQQHDNASLLIGNHDQLYFDLASGDRSYFERLPEWIQHSVELTLHSLDLKAFRQRFVWQREVAIDRLLVAHAGPFGAGDWTYVNALDDHKRAATTLAERGVAGGVFGHTHRSRWYTGEEPQASAEVTFGVDYRCGPESTLVANCGAIGQPRERRGTSAILRISMEGEQIAGVFEPIVYDVAAHVDALHRAPLPTATQERLSAFFKNAI